MTTNEARLAIFAALLAERLDDERIAHLPTGKRLDALANLAVLASERLRRSIERFEEKPSSTMTDVMRDWRLDQ